MPTYNYYCSECDTHFSYFQKMSEIAKSNCEKCEGKINRVITGGTGLIFKGSGFYLTDYKNDTKSKVDVTESNNSAKSGSKKEDNPESKSSGLDKKSTTKKEKKNA
ncbi:MAG: zinc ribbon domain-containing protein [Candidatus Marinimicrobia bacterium]|nr:zinc ribbon domain-containing protein [Candidatus Neomarinimicrobiota bacterium]